MLGHQYQVSLADRVGLPAEAAGRCMDPVTTEDGRPVDAILNPVPGLTVRPGPITQRDGSCNVGTGSAGR
jgi:hypothetical protein